MPYQSVNQYDGKILKTFEELTDKQLETAIETAATCFATWRDTTFAQRAVVVAKAAAIVRTRLDEFARLATLEMGKLIDEARGSGAQRRHHRLLCQNAERFLAPQHVVIVVDRCSRTKMTPTSASVFLSALDQSGVVSLFAVSMSAGAFCPIHLALLATIAAMSVLRRIVATARLIGAFHDEVPF